MKIMNSHIASLIVYILSDKWELLSSCSLNINLFHLVIL